MRIKYFKEIGFFLFFIFLFFFIFFFFEFLNGYQKESKNNKIAILSTKWVGQWGMVGYAHKKYKDNIFQWNKIEPTKRE